MSEPSVPDPTGGLGGPMPRPDGAGLPPGVGGGRPLPGGGDAVDGGLAGDGDIGEDTGGLPGEG